MSSGKPIFFPASANQKRMYVLHQLSPNGTEYNVPVALRLEGEINVHRLRGALRALVARHANLRTSFKVAGTDVKQRIAKSAKVTMSRRRAKDNSDIDKIRRDFVRPFKLHTAPLFRSRLIELAPGEKILLMDFHHIICDGVTIDILLDDLGRLYDGQALARPSSNYKDFVRWQKKFAKTPEAKKQARHWQTLLAGDRPTLNLPIDFPRKRSQSFAGDRIFVRPGKDICAELRALAAKARVSMYMLLLAAYYVLLSKYAGQEDIIVGTLVAGRRAEKFRKVSGLFVNTLLMRSCPQGDLEFSEYLKQVRGECLDAFENQDYQFEDLVEWISPTRDLGRNPLFDTSFGLLTQDEGAARCGGVNFSRYELNYDISKFDVSLTAIELQDQGLALEFEYCTELYRAETIQNLSVHYLNILKEVVANPHVIISEIRILSASEKRALIAPVGQRPDDREGIKPVIELFHDQVRKAPMAPALMFGEMTLTYSELDQRSNDLAIRLKILGSTFGSLVGIGALPSTEMVVAILSVLKLGAAYLPLDPMTPTDRFNRIVADSGISILLIQDEQERFASLDLSTLLINDDNHNKEGVVLPAPVLAPNDMAYIIYTSGSTGTPKGVVVSHGALANYVCWAAKTYASEGNISFALHSPLWVDLTVTSVFVPLVTGNRIVIYQNDDAIGLMREVVKDNQVQLIKLTPTHLSLLSEVDGGAGHEASQLRGIIVGGENLKTKLADKIHAGFHGRIRIFNEYGPTEACVGCMIYEYQPGIDTGISVPIGRAIDNARVLLLDKYANPVPEGVTGELYVAGVCLAEGYLNNSQMTDERFVVIDLGSTQLRMYRTGDLARMLPNGMIEFLGREDDQVKVRGYRIELGEIEANIKRIAGVQDVVVTRALDPAGDPYLCAYLVMNNGVSPDGVKSKLAKYLPEYMVPTWFVSLESLPVGKGGKLNKGALPDPRHNMVRTRPYTAPETKVEVAMVRIWEQVLGHKEVSIDDNFFDLGGQSLKATFMIARVNRELRANLSLRDLFTHSVIRELAALVEAAEDSAAININPVGPQDYYLTSSAQQRLYILKQLAPMDVQYNVPWVIKITGQTDLKRWEGAFRTLIARHESFRTSFALIDDEIVQKVHSQVAFSFEHRDYKSDSDLTQEIERFVRPFDLDKAPLIRCVVIETSAMEHLFIVDMHHIVSDGVSVEIVLHDLCGIYRGQSLEPMAIQYKDYAAWQSENSKSQKAQEQAAYWKKVFAGELPTLNFPTDFSYGSVQSFEGDLVKFEVDPATSERLRRISRKCKATMNMTLLAAYTILLSKYADQEDIIIGTPVAGRTHALVQKIVGMFVNLLALRNKPRKELTFSEFLLEVKGNALDAYNNQDYPFEELIDGLEIERDLSRHPLFDTVFAFQEQGRKQFNIDDEDVELLDFEWKISKFAVTLLVTDQDEGLNCELEYSTKLFRRSTIERLGVHYRHILEQITSNPDLKIGDIELMTESERHQTLIEFNQTEHHYPINQSIHRLFEAQVEKRPDHIAVVSGNDKLSYFELNRRANMIGRILISHDVAREEIVGVIAESSIEMVVGVLAVLKAGCAFLPIDRGCPEDRARGMLDNSGARIVLEAGPRVRFPDTSRVVINLSSSELYSGDGSNLCIDVCGHDLAYVNYTSGTTGVPKGVMIEHHSVNNLSAWHNKEFKVTHVDRAAKYARFNFDASVWEIFPYLHVGATLCMLEEQILLDLPQLNRFFEENDITVSFLPTQVCELFMELDNKSLRFLLTGGDRLRRFEPKSYQVVNNYGPTESTVLSTSYIVVDEPGSISIGGPIFNTQVYILDQNHKPVPIGMPGELYIAGAGLARGYLNDPVQTDAKFIANPFEPGGKIYQTGDLVKWRPDGKIEFIGRTDKQVKIRGCRTEPREIEANILAHDAVEDAVVVAREDCQNNNYLCACIVWKDAEEITELKSYLARHLPDYMMPSYFLTVKKMPLNASGKVDHSALPEPLSPSPSGEAHSIARGDTERRLALIWREVLGRDHVGINENFFEIGGHSLRATIMLAKANKEFKSVVALSAVFDNPTIASLALSFESSAQYEGTMPQKISSRLHYATTPIQKLLHAICTAKKGVEYNLPMAFELHGNLDVAKLEDVFRQLIERHESLRTSFVKVGGRLMQTVLPAVDFSIDVLPENDEETIDELARDFIRPIELDAAPLMRAALVPKGKDHHILLMDHHHLISDGSSVGILFQEMTALYAGEELPALAITYKDYAQWLGDHLRSKKVREQEKYWINVFSDPPSPLKLDTDYPNPEKFSFAGGRINFSARSDVHDGVKALCAERGVTLYMLLLAAYNVLLSKYSGREDIIVGVPTVGRYIADVQDIVGTFVSTHAVRSQPQAEICFDEFLEQVKAAVRGTLDHQEYQLWDLMLTYSKETKGGSLFNTVFVVQDQAFEAMDIPGLEVEEIEVPYHIAKFDLTLGAIERAGRLDFELEYNSDLFRRSTAKRIAGHFAHIIEQIVADPSQKLRQLEVMTPLEMDNVLHQFNGDVADTSPDGHVVKCFEAQAQEFPTRVAVICDGRSLTYCEVNLRANKLARYLLGKGVGVGDVVAIMVPSSFEMIVGVLAILKAGAAYLPLSDNFPDQRIEYLLSDSGAKCLLCGSTENKHHLKTAIINIYDEVNYSACSSNLDVLVNVEDVAYVTYVADMTGLLKRVMIEHRSLFDRCQWFAKTFTVTHEDRSAKYGDLMSCASIMELFPFFNAGATVCLLPKKIEHNVEGLNEFLNDNGVTIGWLPVALCQELASHENASLRVLITTGRDINPARRSGYELVRVYGTAENTEITTCCAVRARNLRTIVGKPITNSQVYIFGHDGGVQPIGVTGELFISGAGLARGDLGSESTGYVSNPYVEDAKMYRTGVSARWLADGQVELTGFAREASIDGQRVFMAEIEKCLESHENIADAAVVFDDEKPLSQRLVAFVVLHHSLRMPPYDFVQELKQHLGQWLPDLMIPEVFVKLGGIPLDKQGKVLYSSLPVPDHQIDSEDTSLNNSTIDETVASIVEALLDQEQVHPTANLFDLGMDSLKAMSLVARINDSLGISPDICQILTRPTTSDISHHLSEILHDQMVPLHSVAPRAFEPRLQ